MPISPGVIYAVEGQKPATNIGMEPTAGLVQLCQTGNPATKFSELKSNPKVKSVAQVTGPILPGKSVSVEISFETLGQESLHYVAMYGKSKEVCASIDVTADQVRLLYKGYSEVLGRDSVISAGAFTEPSVVADADAICASAGSAIGCLRALSTERKEKKQVHFFGGYLPSLLSFIEGKFGSEETLSLIIPTSGALSYSLNLKH